MKASLISIAVDAGSAILKIYNQGNIEVTDKEDDSPLTAADMAAHNLIVERLTAAFPYPVFSEEDPIEYSVRKDWETFWLVDPLDGTKNFIARDGQFTVNIALVQGTEPVLGVVHAPAMGLTYFGGKGSGGVKIADQKESTLGVNTSREAPDLIAAVSSFHNTPESGEFCKAYDIRNTLNFGSSLKVCKLAEGEIDLYPRLNGTSEWDTAASHIILKEAGGKMIDIVTKEDMVYNKENHRNNYFIASRNDLDFDWPLV